MGRREGMGCHMQNCQTSRLAHIDQKGSHLAAMMAHITNFPGL